MGRWSRRSRNMLSVLFCIAMLPFIAAQSAAASSPVSPDTGPPDTAARPKGGSWAALPEGFVTITATSGVISAGGCSYRQVNDDPHYSSPDASIHAWWNYEGGSCPSQANVDAGLQALWCSTYSCSWKTVATNSGDVYAGGGRGKRVTARRACTASSTVGWRGYTDVDLPGINDPSGVTYSNAVNLPCRP